MDERPAHHPALVVGHVLIPDDGWAPGMWPALFDAFISGIFLGPHCYVMVESKGDILCQLGGAGKTAEWRAPEEVTEELGVDLTEASPIWPLTRWEGGTGARSLQADLTGSRVTRYAKWDHTAKVLARFEECHRCRVGRQGVESDHPGETGVHDLIGNTDPEVAGAGTDTWECLCGPPDRRLGHPVEVDEDTTTDIKVVLSGVGASSPHRSPVGLVIADPKIDADQIEDLADHGVVVRAEHKLHSPRHDAGVGRSLVYAPIVESDTKIHRDGGESNDHHHRKGDEDGRRTSVFSRFCQLVHGGQVAMKLPQLLEFCSSLKSADSVIVEGRKTSMKASPERESRVAVTVTVPISPADPDGESKNSISTWLAKSIALHVFVSRLASLTAARRAPS